METLIKDIRYATRSLLARPGFTAVAVLTLALGIGANTTLFSFVNGILLRPLPYQDAERLVVLDETAPRQGIASFDVSYPNFVDWREQNQVFQDIGIYQSADYSTFTGNEPEQLPGAVISQGLFEILGVAPKLGRTFTADEDRPETDNTVILGYGLWQRNFAAATGVIGQSLTVNGRPRTIIGVMPPEFRFPDRAELWLPVALNEQLYTRTDHGLRAIAKLKAGVSLEQAQAEMTMIAGRIEAQHPVTNQGLGVNVFSLRDQLVQDYRRALLILLGVVGFVLLIACANVANLLLARTSARGKELALRAALGAGKWRIVRELLTEGAVLGFLGGGIGLLAAFWGKSLLLRAIPEDLPFWMRFDLDLRVLGFTFVISFLTVLIFALGPAWQASKVDLNETLKEGGRGGTATSGRRLRNVLVIAEVAVSLLLLVGAGLMLRSFANLQRVRAGFDPTNVLTVNVPLSTARYPDKDKRAAFFKELVAGIRALPGMESAGAISDLPLRSHWGRGLTVEGRPVLSVNETLMIEHSVVTPDYFRALGIPLLQGRDFADADAAGALRVTIIDERLAQEYWPGESPLGKRIRFGPPENNEPWHTIVGVVGAVRNESPESIGRPTIYVSYQQIPVRRMTLVLRSHENPASLTGAVKKRVQELDRTQPITSVLTMEEVVAQSVWQRRFYTILFSFFAAVALILAAIGIYGVMSYAIVRRTHEIGIRMALGAQRLDVFKIVVGQGMALALTGVAIGLGASLALTRLMSGLLFGVSSTDLTTFISFAFFLVVVAALACYLPARRATKVDPLAALRYE